LKNDLKEKQVELDTSVDHATELSNKLNDVQAAAWFKDQKIKKISGEETQIKIRLSQEDSELKSNVTQLHKVVDQVNMMKLDLSAKNMRIIE